MLPNEDFRKPKNISDRRFEHFFKGVSIRFGPRLLEKCSTRRSEMFFGFLKSSFGEHKVAIIFCNHLEKLCSIQETPTHRITSHVAIIFCNHLAKLLQKIVASQKNQHIGSHHMLLSSFVIRGTRDQTPKSPI